MPFRPAVLSYDDLRKRAEEFLEEFHEERTLPVPIEEIVEFDFEIELVPLEGILDDLEVDAFLTSGLKREFQANSFAGLVLVPAPELRTQFDAAMRAAREAGLSEFTLSSEAGQSYIAKWLADQFEVSEQVIEKRMEKDGLWVPPAPPTPSAPPPPAQKKRR